MDPTGETLNVVCEQSHLMLRSRPVTKVRRVTATLHVAATRGIFKIPHHPARSFGGLFHWEPLGVAVQRPKAALGVAVLHW